MHQQPSPLGILAKKSLSNSDRWFADSTVSRSLPHMMLAMCGEVGQVADLIKHLDRGDTSLSDTKTRVELATELADVFIYFLNICAKLNIDPQVIYDHRTADNERRFAKQQRMKDYDDRMELVDGVFIQRQHARE